MTPWPGDISSGFYWYGQKKHSPGRQPPWILSLNRVVEGSQPNAGESSEVSNAPKEVEATADTETELTKVERSTVRADETTTGLLRSAEDGEPPKTAPLLHRLGQPLFTGGCDVTKYRLN